MFARLKTTRQYPVGVAVAEAVGGATLYLAALGALMYQIVLTASLF